jgi:isoleucyl-tRNA synthetase
MGYAEVEQNPDFPQIESGIIERWLEDRTFEASVARRSTRTGDQSNEFVFYDGPPFANGLPHYGHLATGFVKDLVPRYQTMRGRQVPRRFGWDCHGLPAELEVEQEIGVHGRNAILEYGIARFNSRCRESVLKFTKEWESYVTRQARWVDFRNDYKTMDRSYMESVIWAFKELWNKGLIYEGYRVVPYSWAAQTPLSNFETRLDNSFRERADPALTIAFTLLPDRQNSEPAKLLAWTTTPWTLPSNLALCVREDLDYAVMECEGQRWILADVSVERYSRELKGFRQIATVQGAEFVGRHYQPLFPYFADAVNSFAVVAADFVSADDGTGVVHIAPGFGEEDLEIGRAHGLPIIVPVDAAGAFTELVPDYVGQNVFAANDNIIKDLKARKLVIRHEQYRHSYPHCWRTDQPLIYMAINSWYLAVSRFRDRMVELNGGIRWVPEFIRDGLFGNWLANARDWNISRNRFWGAPLPVWKSSDPRYPRVDVYGSLDEIERDFGVRPADLHRPMIDELTRQNPDDPTGQSVMRRVPDVLDCWFESGSMPFAQLHYPFENKNRFEANFPGDFIVEYVAQTRGWFYTLMVLSTALFDRAPFRNCICHGVVLDEQNKKLSKRLKNYPDPNFVFETYGADALRWYMMSSPLMTGGDLTMSRDGSDIAKEMRQVILRIWNAYSFFTLYANIDRVQARFRMDQAHVLDRYILGKARQLIADIGARLDIYNLPGAYAAVPGFVDALNNWYIRSRRGSFWSEGCSEDKQDAFDTLYTALTLFCRALAPMMPLITERIYTALTGERSVHLTDWPDVESLPDDRDLLDQMDLCRDICSSVLSLREAHRRRTRLPLKTLTVAHPDAAMLKRYGAIIAESVNVKTVLFTAEVADFGSRDIKVNSKLGAKLGIKFKEVLAAQRARAWIMRTDGHVEIAGIVLDPHDFELRLQTRQGLVAEPFDSWRGVVALDTEIYPELQAEGWARDFVRLVQTTRKQAAYNVTDRIRIAASISPELAHAFTEFNSYVKRETLAVAFDLVTDDAFDRNARVIEDELDQYRVKFSIDRVAWPETE